MRAIISAGIFAIVISLVVSVVPCAAQEQQQEQQQPAPAWEGSLVFGVQVLEGDRGSSKFEEYRDVPSGPWLDLLSIAREDAKTGKYLLLDTSRPGMRDARATLRVGRYGVYGLEIYWDKTPHLLSLTGRTIFQQSGSTFTLPDAVQEKLQEIAAKDLDPIATGTQIDTAAFGAIVNGLAQPTALRVDRETVAVSFNREVNERVAYSASLSNERRTGNMPIGTAFSFTNQVELPMPVDYRTRDVNADVEYRARRGVVRLGYWGSFFENENAALVWDNPISAADAAGAPSRGRLPLAPSNRSHTLSLTGAVDLGRDTRLTGVLSAARWTQDDALLPYTINSALGAPAVPYDSADAKIRSTLAEFVLTSRPADGVSLTARYRQRKVRNRTPQRVFDVVVIGDAELADEEVETEPSSFETRNLSLDAGWDIRPKLALRLGAERETWKRTHREVGKTDEDTLQTSLDYRPSEKLLARLSLKRSRREIDGTYDGGEAQLPQLRKFDEADRDRDSIALLLDYSPGERWSTTLTVNSADDDYKNSLYGLRDDRVRDVSLDAAYAVSDRTSIFAGVSFERYRYRMDSRYRPVTGGQLIDDPLNDWRSTSKDTVRTYWLGCNRTVIPDKLDWDVSFSFTDGKGQVDAVGVPGGDSRSEPFPFPDMRYKHGALGTGVNYRVGPDRALRFGYRLESYDETDFATDVMQPYMGTLDPGSATSVYLGARQPDYRAHFFTLSLQQKF
jgi:MtrB/PioB family decaheme-associated outer membrane protein